MSTEKTDTFVMQLDLSLDRMRIAIKNMLETEVAAFDDVVKAAISSEVAAIPGMIRQMVRQEIQKNLELVIRDRVHQLMYSDEFRDSLDEFIRGHVKTAMEGSE